MRGSGLFGLMRHQGLDVGESLARFLLLWLGAMIDNAAQDVRGNNGWIT
ncbi:hypothetical protein BN130_1782 [Cronobacter malonaticus 507]|nr:hypothetical protein BN130_1782 [Cronobacter malonaticus 507]